MKHTPKPAFIALLLLALLYVCIAPLNDYTIRGEEPRRAIVAMEMMASGNYTMPTINALPYYNKPPVFNWVVASFMQVFGWDNYWGVRLPSILSLFLAAGLIFLFVQRYLDRPTALYTSLAYVTSGDILFYFSMLGEIDLFYTLLVLAQVMAIFHFFQQKKWLSLFVLSYCFAAIGTLTKGIPSIAFQGLTLVAYLIYKRQWRLLFAWQHFVGIGVFVAMVGGYFLAYHQHNDALVYLLKLLDQSSQRSSLEHGWMNTATHLLVNFPVQLLSITAPFCLLLLFFRKKLFSKNTPALLSFSLVFVVSNIWIYWLSPGSRTRYLYMFLPFLLLPLCYAYVHFAEQIPKRQRFFKHFVTGLCGLIAILFVALAIRGDYHIMDTQPIRAYVTVVVLLGLIGGLWWYGQKMGKLSSLMTLIALLVIVRFGFNEMVVSDRAATSSYIAFKENAADIQAVVGDAPLYLTGNLVEQRNDLSIGGQELFAVEWTEMIDFKFALNYYLLRQRQQIIAYKNPTERIPNAFYIAPTWWLDKNDLTKEIEVLKEVIYPHGGKKDINRSYTIFRW